MAKKFTLKSGNKTSFKEMGSTKSQEEFAKELDHEGADHTTEQIKKGAVGVDYDTTKKDKPGPPNNGDIKTVVDKERVGPVENVNLDKEIEEHNKWHAKDKQFNFNKKNDYSKKNTYVDPDAPGTPGKSGYEPPVKRSDLDDKGKKIWDSHRNKE